MSNEPNDDALAALLLEAETLSTQSIAVTTAITQVDDFIAWNALMNYANYLFAGMEVAPVETVKMAHSLIAITNEAWLATLQTPYHLPVEVHTFVRDYAHWFMDVIAKSVPPESGEPHGHHRPL